MKKLSIFTWAALLACTHSSIYAQEVQSVGLNVGSTGVDIEYTRMVNEEYHLAFRIAMGGLSYSNSYDDTDTHYDTDIKLFSLGTTLEYHPFNGGFYMGTGAYYQNNRFNLEATPSEGSYDFNGHNYPAEAIGSISGEVINLNNLAPYIGIGYDASLFNEGNLFFTFKAGAWYQGTPKVDLTAHDCALEQIPGSPLGCNDLRYDLDKEEEDINEDIKDYKWWPVLQVGLSYRF